MLLPLGTHRHIEPALFGFPIVRQLTCPRKSHKRLFSPPGESTESGGKDSNLNHRLMGQ